jgi:DNA-binding CsgD family transcriptional regulator
MQDELNSDIGKPIFSQREKEICSLVEQEFTIAEISAQLSVSRRTLDRMLRLIRERVGAKSNVGIVAYEKKLLEEENAMLRRMLFQLTYQMQEVKVAFEKEATDSASGQNPVILQSG